jgi:hypothetical protein
MVRALASVSLAIAAISLSGGCSTAAEPAAPAGFQRVFAHVRGIT